MDIRKKLEAISGLDEEAKSRVLEWLSDDIDEKTRDEVVALIEKDPKSLVDAFYTTLSFGTGGLRSVMGAGTNRMNSYTVSFATQGLANYMKKTLPDTLLKVAIGYDSRHNSKAFAESAAAVLAGNGIHVFLFEALRPTPLVSFACRFKGCGAAIMITASHNPPEYNGYKVYWSDGAQVLPPHDTGIIQEVNKIVSRKQVAMSSFPDPKITLIGKIVDDAYLAAIRSLQLSDTHDGGSLRILYSSLHGTGITMVPQALAEYGFSTVHLVEEQCIPDGSFPTTRFPNPEEEAALSLGIKQMERDGDDIFLATDPDCDRIGVVIRHEEKLVRLNGNEVACILADFVCRKHQSLANGAFVKSIVTSDLFREVVESYGARCFDVLTGFKYIAEKIREWEMTPSGLHYLFGGEESYGYLVGTIVRDKDAVTAACLIAEMALDAKKSGRTLIDLLYDLYKKHGVFREGLSNFSFEDGRVGKEKQKNLMQRLRAEPPATVAGVAVTFVSDYLTSQRKNRVTNDTTPILLPKSDVLLLELEDKSKLFIRPSGTEPKTKVYVMAREPYAGGPIAHAIATCDEKVRHFQDAVQKLMQ